MIATPRRRWLARCWDGLWRVAYRAAYFALRTYWRIARPKGFGAHVAIWCDDELFLIQNSYRSDRSVPGGGVNRDEDPLHAAARELREETGIELALDQLAAFGRIDVEHDSLRDQCHFFEAHLPEKPTLAIDHREVVAADWLDPRSLDPAMIHAPTRAYLEFLGILAEVEWPGPTPIRHPPGQKEPFDR